MPPRTPRTGDDSGDNSTESKAKQVIDFTEARTNRLNEKRRKTERIFFKHLLSVYCITGNAQMRPLELIDVSEDGCSFQVPFDSTKPWPNDSEPFPIRLYFSQDTYIPLQVKIQNSRPSIENGARYIRFGCMIDKEMSAYPAYQQFVRFLKTYGEHAHKDKGDISVFYI